MESDCCCRFVLLDFGHPMTTNSISNIINSLENILALKLAFSRRAKQTFGISILNSDFRIFESEANLRKNYDVLIKNLQASLKMTKLNSRVTVQEYKHSLSDSIEGVLREFQKFKKASIHCYQSEIAVAIITKKTASILADILTDVSKLQRNIPYMPLIKNYKIIQILNEQEKISKVSDKDTLIDWTFCPDNIYDLNCFFKEWFLHRHQEMRIIFSKELEVKCDVDDCMVNPVSRTFDLFNDIQPKGSDGYSLLGGSKPAYELQITNRLSVNSFCPTFGIPHRVCATESCGLKWTESQLNSKIFKTLCRELHRTGQGLLARSVSVTEKGELRKYYFLTSDGGRLLMSDVAPAELYLPARVKFTGAAPESSDDETAASLVRACFEKIKLLNEYTPRFFSSGVYDCLRNYLAQTVRKSERNPQLLDRAGDYFGNRKKRPKSGAEMENANVHPALLSPNVVEKYRKIQSQAFNLPELSKDYNDN